MSVRSFRRGRERELERSRRRARRAGIAAGAAIGATVLFAPPAQAASFEVDTLADTPPDGCAAPADTTDPVDCTLREALEAANANSEDDTITFESSLSGEVTLELGQLMASGAYDVSIIDDGPNEVSISGDRGPEGRDAGDTRILNIASFSGAVSIDGLDLNGGFVGNGSGAAIAVGVGSDLTVSNSTLTGGYAESAGGAIFSNGGQVVVNDSVISGNEAGGFGGGVALGDDRFGGFGKYGGSLEVIDTEVTGNTALLGGGLSAAATKYTTIEVTSSEISGNTATGGPGGGIAGLAYDTIEVADSQISGNDARAGGGVALSGQAGFFRDLSEATFRQTTIADNAATDYGGGGMAIGGNGNRDSVLIARSTISGNDAGEAAGGGIAFRGDIFGEIELSNSTISGNTAGYGGGVSVDATEGDAPDDEASTFAVPEGGDGSLELGNATIADNAASEQGGGIYLGFYGGEGGTSSSSALPLPSTIVADNTAGGAANDLAEAPETDGGEFELTYSLVENPGSATLTQDPAGSSILGTDPQLGALADNGGPTLTHLPEPDSPVIDQGIDNETAREQRGLRRTIDLAPDDNPQSDATDIGAVELQDEVPDPPGPGVPPPSETRRLTEDEIPPRCPLSLETADLALGGNEDGQTIRGGPGDDILRGFGGVDTVAGRAGDDCLTGDGETDTVRGGSGNDLGLGGANDDLMTGGTGDDAFYGNGGNDRIRMGSGDDIAVGGAGDDNLTGGKGNDTLRGSGGDDRMFGGAGDDDLRGGSGDDVIKGGGGFDVIDCGPGDDKVVVRSVGRAEIAGNCETIKVLGPRSRN